MRCSRSLEKPTSSGLPFGSVAARPVAQAKTMSSEAAWRRASRGEARVTGAPFDDCRTKAILQQPCGAPVADCGERAARLRAHHRHVDDVLGDEPDLQLVAADDLADDQVVGPVVAALAGDAG